MAPSATRLALALTALVGGCAERGGPATLAPHQPGRLLGAHVVGRVPAARPIDLVLGLRLRDHADLASLLTRQGDARSGDYGRYLKPDEFAASFAPSPAEYEALIDALERAGLEVTRRVVGRTTLTVRGAAADVERLFGTELYDYEDDAPRGDRPRTFYAASDRFVRSDLLSLVESVSGLDDANRWRSHRHGPLSGADPNTLPGGSADPADLHTLYGISGALHPTTNQPLLGVGETIAILGTGYAPGDDDIANFVSKYGLPTNPKAQYVRVFLGGGPRDPDALNNNEYGENVLDADMVMATAPLANVVHVHTASNAPGLFSDGIAFIVNQVPQAHTVTLSYGGCERISIYETLQMNAMFLQAQAEGQAWFIASGDNGTDGCADGSSQGVPSVDWPSSSPYTLGVGGTALSGGVEVAWNGGGGGQSELFPKPLWQEGVGPYPGDGARDVPDVAALAGEPGVSTIFGTTVIPSQGTSAAAPIWAGVWALLDEARGGVGMSNPQERLYGLGGLGFHDITIGNNGDGTIPGYHALPGYDLATGWGSPNLAALIGALP